MTKTAVGTEIDQPFDVHCDLFAKFAFDFIVALDDFPDAGSLGL
jgi:hypothetical protein